ncbi:hypothetical protein AVEN_172502-1 [Araneus ventricosus]|uniref:Uncharacterized protein n=1 Tax=Araneus ventricosus TaxID=182803 RepID=A0A4Y2DTJ4_ARAVE|nr:hypothetical protein AVEN_172502-1 [Araneus ventricosus]
MLERLVNSLRGFSAGDAGHSLSDRSTQRGNPMRIGGRKVLIFVVHLVIMLDIPDKAVLRHFEQRPVWFHPFKPIHLGGSFTKAPKRTTGRRDLLLPAFETRPLPLSDPPLEGSDLTSMAEWTSNDVGLKPMRTPSIIGFLD